MSTVTSPQRIVVLISGSGTNLQALIDATKSTPNTPEPLLPNAEVVLVVSNRKDAYGRQRARDAGIQDKYHNLVPYKKAHGVEENAKLAREAYDKDLAELILSAIPDIVVLAGFMHIVSARFLEPLVLREVPVINLHPALPEEYDGAAAIERAWSDFMESKGIAGSRQRTGVMVHHVILDVDRGDPIITEEVPLHKDELLAELEERMHKVEHRLIVEGTKKILQDRGKANKAQDKQTVTKND